MMRYNFLHIGQEPFQRFNKDNTISLLSPLTVVSFIMVVLCFFIGCSTNYQGPLRYSGNSSEQIERYHYSDFNTKDSYKPIESEYIIDTLYVIDTVIEECPLDTPEETVRELILDETSEQKIYESCPLIFDTITTGDLLTESVKILRNYIAKTIGGNFIYEFLVIKFLKILEIYLPDILDRILEIFELDELIEKQRYPEVYIYLSIHNSKNKFNNGYSSKYIQRVNYISGSIPEYSSFSSGNSYCVPSKSPSTPKGLDTVH